MVAAHETMRRRSLAAEFSETNEVGRVSGLGYIHVERYRMSAACSVASVCRFNGRRTEQKNFRTYSLFTVVDRLQILVMWRGEACQGSVLRVMFVVVLTPYPTWPGDMLEFTFFCRVHDR